MTQYLITSIITGGPWTGVTQPVTKEFVALARPDYEENLSENQVLQRRRFTIDPHFQYLLHFKRIIIVQLALQNREDQSFSRTHESNRSFDDYELTIKTGSYSDSKNVYDELRNILLSQPTSNANNKWVLMEMEPIPSRGKFSYTVEARGYLTGKPRDDNT